MAESWQHDDSISNAGEASKSMIGPATQSPALLIANLVVDLPRTGRVLDGVNLQVDHGETVALVGASGCVQNDVGSHDPRAAAASVWHGTHRWTAHS